ncbi:MAG: tetratricopeptide repeat protein [Candidatus Acidiferrum sp.]|jgi:tetratricopeptide (TPR) repeat protein
MALTPAQYMARVASVSVLLFGLSFPVSAQRPSGRTVADIPTPQTNPITVKICVRDSRGLPLEFAAFVRLYSVVSRFDVKSATGEGSTANFPNVPPGEYEVEVRAQGYQTASEAVNVVSFGGDVSVYLYLQNETGDAVNNVPGKKVVMAPKLRYEVEKGLSVMQKKDYAGARTHFLKASQMAPANPDVLYLLGTSELGLKNIDAAKSDFDNALRLEPSNQRTLLALGDVELQSGDVSSAILILEKAFDLNGADWRIHYLLASAYFRAGRPSEAEMHASRGAALAKEKGAAILYLLGEIKSAEGKTSEAKETWERVLAEFPNDPIVQETKGKLEGTAGVSSVAKRPANAIAKPPAPQVTPAGLIPVEEHPWAPPDIDAKEYRIASDAACDINEVLARADLRLKSQLMNFEKFTATERIEHQQVDRYGVPGPVFSKEFSYIVFVRKIPPDTFYLEENRAEGNDLSAFPTPLATTGLNSLGISVLRASSAKNYEYLCEGLTNLRGEATWQIRFEERKGANSSTRQWRKKGQIVNIPLKGRFWLTASNYDLLRIETDLVRPLPELELSLDHLIVDYGPVSFENGNVRLWLPWSAEMFMQLHGNRYHHKHYLTNYYLFSVETSHTIGAPKNATGDKNQLSPDAEAGP